MVVKLERQKESGTQTAPTLPELENFILSERVRRNALDTSTEGAKPLIDQLSDCIERITEYYDPPRLEKLLSDYWLYTDLEQHQKIEAPASGIESKSLSQRYDAYTSSVDALCTPTVELLQKLKTLTEYIRDEIEPATEREFSALATLESSIEKLSTALDLTPPGVEGNAKRMPKAVRSYIQNLEAGILEFRVASESYLELLKPLIKERGLIASSSAQARFPDLEAQGMFWTERLDRYEDSEMVQLRIKFCAKEISRENELLERKLTQQEIETNPNLKLLSEIDVDSFLTAITVLQNDQLLRPDQVEKMLELKTRIDQAKSGTSEGPEAITVTENDEALSAKSAVGGPKKVKKRETLDFNQAAEIILGKFTRSGRLVDLRHGTLMTLLSRDVDGYTQRIGKQFERVIKELGALGVLELPQSRFEGPIRVNAGYKSRENPQLQKLVQRISSSAQE